MMKTVKQQFLELEQAIKRKNISLSLLERMEVADIASFLSKYEEYFDLLIPSLIQIKKIGPVLSELPEDKLGQYLKQMNSKQIEDLFESTSIDYLVYLIKFIELERRDSILSHSSKADQIQRFLQYSENQAGRIMQSPAFSLSAQTTAFAGIEELRKRSLEEFISYIYCVDDHGKLIGVASMRQLATVPAETPLENFMKKDVVSVQATMSTREVAKVAAHYDFLCVPVVDENQKLLGIITMDDIIDIIQDQNTANIYAQAGLQMGEKIHTSPWVSIKNRLPWMFLNLALAIFASSVISLFEETMSFLIILASLKNVVASMGGNTAIQTLTVTTRGMATGDFRFTTVSQAMIKEIIVGLVMGIVMGSAAGVVTYLWKSDILVSVVIFIAMLLNFIIAGFVGTLAPILLSRFKKDPVAGSGVIVTMFTDIFGFLTFLGIAKLGLYLVG